MTIKNTLNAGQIANRAFLKVKIRHLALEPAIIRNVADQHRRRYMSWRLSQLLKSVGGKDDQAGVLEAFQTQNPYEDPWASVRLNDHRLRVIRPEARAAQLAYAFIRGKDYASAEVGAKSEPDWKRVGEIALKYGDFPYGTTKDEARKAVVAWRDKSLAQQDKAA